MELNFFFSLGFLSTLARDSLGSVFYFSSYEYLKYKFTREGEKGPSVAGTLLAGEKTKESKKKLLELAHFNKKLWLGGCAGVFNWIAALPIDTLKSRLQVAPVKHRHFWLIEFWMLSQCMLLFFINRKDSINMAFAVFFVKWWPMKDPRRCTRAFQL